MSDTYTDELFQEKNASKLVPLYRNAFGAKTSSASIKRKFFADYQKVRASYLTLENSSDIVSFYGVISQKATFNDAVFSIAQSCDSMTHKDHSGKGLFINLAKKAYEQLVKDGVNFVYGFPNKAIYSLRIKKLHWKHLENINYFEKKIWTFPFAKVVKKYPALRSCYNSFLNIILRKYRTNVTFFSNSVVEPGIGGVLHDKDYFDYKKGTNKFILNISGINFWVKFDGMLWVGDFERSNVKQFAQALKGLKTIATLTGCSKIAFHFHEGSANDALLQQFLEVNYAMPCGYLNLAVDDEERKFKFCGADFDTW